ncbi:hypothetical protein SAMN05421812_102505 [Asanoa hainanensis]|uniref:DUF4352 domain-containing protein n=1 Tax=Asanoa hainanensis TaxID=560556 RepID=A0A239IQ41_9ACTN|nr:DUF4352 domain-containing protein [Asanoa hainanensis]SNS95681.1 hypothetical protein SAMN05421812_102505 [Asanoa hainanensis]
MLRTALSLALLAPTLPFTAAPAAAQPDASQVDVAMTSDGSQEAEYRVVVRNRTEAPTDLTVRQSVPDGARVTATSPAPGPGGSPGPGSPSELVWTVHLGPYESTTLTTTVAPSQGASISGAACAYVGLAGQPVDCSASVWTPADPGATASQENRWQLWWLPALATLLVVASVLFARYGWPRAARRVAALSDKGRAGVAVLTAIVLLVGLGVLAAALAVPRLAATAAGAQRTPASGWLGPVVTGALGTPLRENAFEFTAYSFTCAPAGGGQRCTAVVGMTNHSAAPEYWHPSLQRLAVAGEAPVSTDVMATRALNGGRDVFDAPVVPGHRLLAQLSWSLPAAADPTTLELHSGAFAQGVRIRV